MHKFEKINFKLISFVIFLLVIFISITLFTETSFKNTLLNISLVLSLFLGILFLLEFKSKKNLSSKVERTTENFCRLEELDSLKTEFIALASHQLRSPLAKIQGYSSMILEEEFGRLPKNLTEPLQRIFISSQDLGFMLNDFLDVAQIEKGQIVYNFKPANLIDILEKTNSIFKNVAETSGLNLKTTYSKNDGINILVDFNKTVSAFSKIFDNAIKYTPTGEVTISVAEKDGDAIVSIRDTGIGISKSEIEEIFERFKRGKNSYNQSVTGSGLGLYVAKEIIEAQEGKIWLKSEGEGKGTTVFVAFPILKN